MLKIGSSQWFEELEKTKFPSYFVFHYLQKGEDKSIAAKIVDSKAKDKFNIKYGALNVSLGVALTGSNSAIVDVKYITSPMQYYQEIKRIAKTWNVEVVDEKEK